MVCTQVDGSVWATLLALIWLYGCKIDQQVEWQFVAMKAASWIGSQKGGISIPEHIHSDIFSSLTHTDDLSVCVFQWAICLSVCVWVMSCSDVR